MEVSVGETAYDAADQSTLSVQLFFFFSSRRRHTRCLSDWSSDVCSSDLGGNVNECFHILSTATGGSDHRAAIRVSDEYHRTRLRIDYTTRRCDVIGKRR